MQTQHPLFKNSILGLLLLLGITAAQAQDNKPTLETAIAAKQFTFEAQTVLPTSGGARQIGGERYQVRVSSDSLRSDLPYFGRVYNAPMNSEGGIHFTTTEFDYSYKPKKKHGGWDISIKPKKGTDVREFLLSVSESGYATLRALSNNRQPISFNGQVHALQQ